MLERVIDQKAVHRKVSKYLALALGVFCSLSTATDWQSDASQSELSYAVSFEQLPLNGQFKEFSVNYTPQQKLRVVVDISSVDMGNSDINDAIRDADWFDIKQHSQAVFFSDNIKAVGEGEFMAEGTLQLKGIKKPVSVAFNWAPSSSTSSISTPATSTKEPAHAAKMSGKLTLSRSDFAIGSQEWASGDQIGIDVSVSFDVQMLKHVAE